MLRKGCFVHLYKYCSLLCIELQGVPTAQILSSLFCSNGQEQTFVGNIHESYQQIATRTENARSRFWTTSLFNVFVHLCLHRERTRSDVCEEQQLSCCARCQDALKDPVSRHSRCPQCGNRSKTGAGRQTHSQTSSIESKMVSVHL